MDGVFLTVPSALYVVYMMPAFRGSSESTCAKIVRDFVGEHDIWRHRLRQSVFFECMTNLEVCAECALIRHKVEVRLSELEAATIQARYGELKCYIDNAGGVRRYYFAKDRTEAFSRLARKVRSEFDVLSDGECYELVVRAFTPKDSPVPITFRNLVEKYKRSLGHYHFYYHAIDARLQQIEVHALDRLEELFADRGSCDGDPVVVAREHYASGQ